MLRTLVKTQSQKSYWRSSQSRSPPKASVQHCQFQWNEGKIIWVKGCKKLVVVIETSSLWSQFSQPGTRAATATNLWTTGATVFQPATAEFGDDTHDRVLTTKISRSLKKLLGLHENHVTPNPRVVAIVPIKIIQIVILVCTPFSTRPMWHQHKDLSDPVES